MDVNYSQPNRRDKCTEIPGIPVEDGYFTDDYGQFNMEVMLELKSMGNHKIFYIY